MLSEHVVRLSGQGACLSPPAPRSAPVRDNLRRYHLLPLLLLGPICALALPSAGNSGEEDKKARVGRKYALVIGVRNYKKDELRPLKYADKDATALASALKGAGYRRVVLMTYHSAADD